MGKLLNEASGRGLGGVARKVLIERIEKSKEAMQGALRYLGHPHAAAYGDATCEILAQQAWLAAEQWVRTHPAKIDPNLIDVVLMAVLKAESYVSAEVRHRIFGGVSLEAELIPICQAVLKKEGMAVSTEVPIGNCRADVVGYKNGLLERWTVAVEAKNAVNECDRLAEQVVAYNPATDETRVVMTPECMAATTLAREELAQPLAFAEYVQDLGAKLDIYDATSGLMERLANGAHAYKSSAFEMLWHYLNEQRAAA